MESKRKNSWSGFIDLGLEFAVAIALGVGLGYLADKKLNTFPLFLVLGLLLGAVSGFLNIYRAAFPQKNSKENSNASHKD